MKFDMGADTLSQLASQTSSASGDLGNLVRQLAQAAEPLEGKFNGSARAAFNRFESSTNEIANNLDASLRSVLAGIQGQSKAFAAGDQQMADQVSSLQSSLDFDSARFH